MVFDESHVDRRTDGVKQHQLEKVQLDLNELPHGFDLSPLLKHATIRCCSSDRTRRNWDSLTASASLASGSRLCTPSMDLKSYARFSALGRVAELDDHRQSRAPYERTFGELLWCLLSSARSLLSHRPP